MVVFLFCFFAKLPGSRQLEQRFESPPSPCDKGEISAPKNRGQKTLQTTLHPQLRQASDMVVSEDCTLGPVRLVLFQQDSQLTHTFGASSRVPLRSGVSERRFWSLMFLGK